MGPRIKKAAQRIGETIRCALVSGVSLNPSPATSANTTSSFASIANPLPRHRARLKRTQESHFNGAFVG